MAIGLGEGKILIQTRREEGWNLPGYLFPRHNMNSALTTKPGYRMFFPPYKHSCEGGKVIFSE